MGLKDNLRKNIKTSLQKLQASGGDMLKTKELVPKDLRSGHSIEEGKKDNKSHKGKSCKEAHPGISHSKWVKKEGEMEEATTAASAGQYVGPLTTNVPVKKKKKKEEFDEATTAASSGSYETPAFLAKNEKNWRGNKKTQWPGGKFVKIKKRCRTFPYCNQGDINALDLTENEKIKNAINEVAKKTGKNKKYVKDLAKKEIEEIIRRGFYKSPITDILGTKTKMNAPIGKIYTMGSNVGGKYE